MGVVSRAAHTTTGIQPEPESRRFGLTVSTRDFDMLANALDRIGDAEREAEVASTTLRIC